MMEIVDELLYGSTVRFAGYPVREFLIRHLIAAAVRLMPDAAIKTDPDLNDSDLTMWCVNGAAERRS